MLSTHTLDATAGTKSPAWRTPAFIGNAAVRGVLGIGSTVSMPFGILAIRAA